MLVRLLPSFLPGESNLRDSREVGCVEHPVPALDCGTGLAR